MHGQPGQGQPGQNPDWQRPDRQQPTSWAPTPERPLYGASGQSPYGPGTAPQPGFGPNNATNPNTAQSPYAGQTPPHTGGFATSPIPPMNQGIPPVTHGGQVRERRRSGTTVVATALVAAVLGGGVALGGNALLNHSNSSAPQLAAPVATSTTPAQSGSIPFAAQQASKFTADIQVAGTSGTAVGSGIVLSKDGYVLTNNHVVSGAGDGATMQVTTSDQNTYAATVVGTSPSYDLAVIKLKDASNLTPATLGTSSNLQVGEQVVAVGSPENLSNTVTSGIVSALSRTVTAGDEQGASVAVYNGLQTDTPINPGNSGGPLVNLAGQVIGINSAVDTGSSSQGGVQAFGLGFAIPIDTARRVANELLADGHATKPILGVTGSLASSSTTSDSDTADTAVGAKITEVQSGSAAANAGLKTGDVVTKVGNERISDYADLMAQILTHKPGETVPLTVTGAGGQRTVQVTLGSAVDTAQTTVPERSTR